MKTHLLLAVLLFAELWKTARSDIELTMARPSGQVPRAFTKGKFIAVPNSDASGLLLALQKTLQAKTLLSNLVRVAEYPLVPPYSATTSLTRPTEDLL